MLHYAKIPQFQVKCLPKNAILIKRIQHRGASGLDSIWLDWMGISEWYEAESTLGRTSNTTLRILSVSGVSLPPLRKKFRQKRSYGFGGYPPPLQNFTRKFFFKKG